MSNLPLKSGRLLFVGGGNIATAVACGLASSGAVAADSISVYDIDSAKLDRFSKLGMSTGTDLFALCEDVKFIFLAVKPGIVSSVMRELAGIDGLLDRAVVISFAAAVSISHIELSAGRDVSVIRTMPSTPIFVGEGVIAVSQNQRVTKKDFQLVCQILSSVATVVAVDESVLNPIISVTGSSPAYVYLFVKAMLEGAEEQGIDQKTALPLILKTIRGSIKMIQKSNESVDQLIKNVASPNGTTLAALNSFENDGFVDSVKRAMTACTNRADEMSEEL